jgi:hypothetical protein
VKPEWGIGVGIEMRTVSLKLSEETMKQVDELRDAFHPFTENRSQVFRAIVDIMHSLVFTKGTLKSIVERLQGMIRNTSYFQTEFDFPAHAAPETGVGLAADNLDARQPRVISISRRVAGVAVSEMAAWFPPFRKETYLRGILA